MVPVSQLADIADKFRRNEIMTSNELRAEIGYKPSDAAQANDISNPNLNKSDAQIQAQNGEAMTTGMDEAMTDSNSSQIDGLKGGKDDA